MLRFTSDAALDDTTGALRECLPFWLIRGHANNLGDPTDTPYLCMVSDLGVVPQRYGREPKA